MMNGKTMLFIMVGAPGSGKSHFVKKFLNRTCWTAISRDEIRFSLLEEGDEYFSKEKVVFKKFISAIQNGLNSGAVVFADATHLNGPSRYKLLNALNLNDVEVIPVVMKTSLETCLKRNANRAGRSCVPEDVLKNMYKVMTDPKNDAENFGKNYYTNIIYVEE